MVSIFAIITAISAAIGIFLVQAGTATLHRWSGTLSPMPVQQTQDWEPLTVEFDAKDVQFCIQEDIDNPTAGAVGAVPFDQAVILSEELLEVLSEDEQRAVIAHELAHLDAHHPLRRAVLSSMSMAALVVFVVSPSTLAAFVLLLCLCLLSIEVVRQEYLADDTANSLVDEATLATSLWTIAAANDGTDDYGRLAAFLQMRPSIPSRLRRLGR